MSSTRLSVLLTVCCLFAGVAAVGPAVADEQTVEPGESIQEAIDDAQPDDTIRIENGTYDEHLSVDVRGLTLLGVDGKPVIRGTEANTSVVSITAENVTLDSLTVTGGQGIGVIDAENRTVDGTGDGIKTDGAAGLTIVDSRVTDNEGWGIYAFDSPGTLVQNNVLSDNVWDGGIFIRSNGTVVRNNVASNNGIDKRLRNRHGIRFTNTSHGRIENNRAVGNEYGGLLFTLSTTNNTIRNNVLRDSGSRGIGTFGGVRENRFVNNTITGSAEFGILTYTPGGDNLFANNTVRNSGNTGIAVDDTDGNTLRNNVVVDSYAGITARGTTGTAITSNTVEQVTTAGVLVSSSDRMRVLDNTVTDAGIGVHVPEPVTDVVVADNRIRNNAHGVATTPAANDGTVVRYNDILDNEGYGVVVYRDGYTAQNQSFGSVPAASDEIVTLNATTNYWGSPPATGEPGDRTNTAGPNVAYEPVTADSTDAPESLTARQQTDSDEEQTDDGQSDESNDTTDDQTDDGSTGDTTDDEQDDETSDEGSDTGDSDEDESDTDGESTDDADEGTEDQSTSDDGDTDSQSGDENGPGFGLVAALVAILSLAGIARQSRAGS